MSDITAVTAQQYLTDQAHRDNCADKLCDHPAHWYHPQAVGIKLDGGRVVHGTEAQQALEKAALRGNRR